MIAPGGDRQHRDFSVREADGADLSALIDLESAAFGAASWGAGGMQAALAQLENRALLGCVNGDTPAAFILWRVMADEAEILTLGVAPGWRGHGFAREILAAATSEAGRAGAESLFLEVDGNNEAAIALYTGSGFEAVGARAGYYRNGADAIIMLKNIL